MNDDEQQAGAGARDNDLLSSKLKGLKVLIVEDDRFLHNLLSRKLKEYGCKVFSAQDGEAALRETKKETPDLILLDIILPGVDGFEVLERLKADEKHKNIPVLILSNLGQEEDIKKGNELGADGFLIKANFTLDEIMSKVAEVVGAKK